MDIHSPSRVIGALGGHVMGGIRVGLEQGFPGLKDKFNQVLNVFNPNASTAEKINVAPFHWQELVLHLNFLVQVVVMSLFKVTRLPSRSMLHQDKTYNNCKT